MLRWLALCIALCALTFGAVFLVSDPFHLLFGATPPPQTNPNDDGKSRPADVQPVRFLGGDLDTPLITVLDNLQTARVSPIVVPGGTVTPIQKQEVPSERPGQILFIARELRPDEMNLVPQIKPLKDSTTKYFSADLNYIAVKIAATAPREGEAPSAAQLQRWREGDDLDSERVVIASEKRYFRELGVGDTVHKGEILAVINPRLALDDLYIKKQKMVVARAEIETSTKTKEEAKQRWDSMVQANNRVPGAYSKEDVRGGQLTYIRYVQEEIAKVAAYAQAQSEMNASITQLKMHEIRAQISGIIKTIYKSRGDAVKELDPVMQLQDYDHLRVESVMEAQYANKVKVGEEVLIEPAIAESPRKVLNGHLQEVTCVAVTKGDKPLILSGSEDRTLRVWDPVTGDQKVTIEFKAAVRSVACTGKGAEANLALVGCSDGSARLFNIEVNQDKVTITPAKELSRRHARSVTCVAFSPNGKIFATGSDDLTICLWDTDTGAQADRIAPAHKSPVTSIQFATDDTFVSAGRDNVLNVWKYEKGKAPVRVFDFDKRSGDVTHLGVSPDGQFVLFDDGKDLRIQSLESRQIVGKIQNSAGIGFKGLALFAPDGKTVLTTSATENRLQLWRTPVLDKKGAEDTTGGRASELRQFVWSTGRENAAAYAPDASFLVTGSQDNQVLIWAMPDKKQIEEKLTGTVSLVEPSLDASSRQVRLWAEVDNKNGWLIPGGTATIVIPPKK